MKVTYDGVGDTLSILLSKKQVAYAEEHEGVIVNYSRDDKPVEIEILNASKFMGELLSTMNKGAIAFFEQQRALNHTCPRKAFSVLSRNLL